MKFRISKSRLHRVLKFRESKVDRVLEVSQTAAKAE